MVYALNMIVFVLGLTIMVRESNLIIHLAGTNRTKDSINFKKGNVDLTQKIAEILKTHKLSTPIIFSSSIQADLDNPYGKSKLAAEGELLELNKSTTNYGYPLQIAISLYVGFQLALRHPRQTLLPVWSVSLNVESLYSNHLVDIER